MKRRGLVALFILIAVALLAGCQMEPKDDFRDVQFIPVGEWSFGVDPDKEGYNITNSALEYYSPYYEPAFPDTNFKGSIEAAIDFSRNAGVLIIKISSQKDRGLTVGKYTCIYYRNYTRSHVLLANPVDASRNPIETDTFGDAEKLFTVDNVNTYVTFWGSGYSK